MPESGLRQLFVADRALVKAVFKQQPAVGIEMIGCGTDQAVDEIETLWARDQGQARFKAYIALV